MKLRFFVGLLAVTAMVNVNLDVFGHLLRQSVANSADVKGSAQVRPSGKGERVLICGSSVHAWVAMTQCPLSGVAVETLADFSTLRLQREIAVYCRPCA